MVPQPEPQPKQDQSRLQAGAHLHQQRNQDMQVLLEQVLLDQVHALVLLLHVQGVL